MEEMDKDAMRQSLLMELIDNMHGRLADKMFPPDPSKDDQPAVTGLTQPGTTATGIEIPRAEPNEAAVDEKSIDTDKDADEPSDEDLEEMMKGMK
jgi:hypothetical protein